MSAKRKVTLFDTTLRDGAQTPGVKFRSEDKLRVARALVDLGVDYVGLGWPEANPTDTKVFAEWAMERAGVPAGKTKTVSFGMAADHRKSVGNDATFQAVMNVSADTYCLFGKTWDYHAHLLGATNAEYLDTIQKSVAHAATKGEAIFDAEHFFQGYEANPEYALAAVKTAYEAGARYVVLCDTNGIMSPSKVTRIVNEVMKHVPGEYLGIHTHNDRGMADANTLAAVEAGVCHVQGTINGLGERCGNANLVNVIGNLVLDGDVDCGLTKEDLVKLKPLSKLVEEVSRRPVSLSAAFVSAASGEQKAGKHVDMFLKDPTTYRSHDPALFGVEERVGVSNQSGVSSFLKPLQDLGLDTSKGNMEFRAVVGALKQAEEDGYDYENCMGSFEVMALRLYGKMPTYFDLSSYRAVVERLPGNGSESATKKSKLAAQATVEFLDAAHLMAEPEVSNGNGPVNALDKAMRRSLEKVYPELKTLALSDYSQDVINRHHGTDAVMQVKIVSRAPGGPEMSTVGVSGNSIDASVNALMDSYALHLWRMGVQPRSFAPIAAQQPVSRVA